MRTLVFAPETFNLAEVTRGIEVARRLPEFRCVFTGFAPTYAQHIPDAGFEVRLLGPQITPQQVDAVLAFDQGRSLRVPFSESDIRERVRSEIAVLEELAPDAVVIGSTVSQLISARALGIPLVYVKPFAYSSPHVRSLTTTGMLPRDSPSRRRLDSAVARAVRAVAPRIAYTPRFLRTVATEHGVELPPATAELLDADLNLVTTVPELLPARLQLPPSYRAIGPVYANLDTALDPAIRGLLQDERVIYFALGSSAGRDLALAVLNGLRDVDRPVIAPVRHYLTERDATGWPSHIHLTDWLPTQQLGDRVAMAITHGGEGTVQTSCVNGWPFVGIPLQLEQRYNVLRCVEAGNARLVTKRAVPKTDWARLVDDVLADRSMARAADQVSTLMRSADGPANAADAIRDLIGQTRGRAE